MRSAFPASETLFIVAAGNFWMSQLNLNISPGQVVLVAWSSPVRLQLTNVQNDR
jgi:hypothetical protein